VVRVVGLLAADTVHTRTEYQWAWGVLLTVISLGLSVLTYLHK
jgi:hypothetical protein